MMHDIMQIWQRTRWLPGSMWRQCRSSINQVASVLRKAKLPQADELIPPLGILMGALALGWWQQSFAAALFAGIGLFFLASIDKTTKRTFAAIRRLGNGSRVADAAGSAPEKSEGVRSDALDEAIGCLKPWLTNEASLTEESAKQCCAVLVDSVAAKTRAATNNF